MHPASAGARLVATAFGAAALSSGLAACSQSEAAPPRRLQLVDVAEQAGIDVVNVSGDPRRWYIVESNGNGAAWLDFDGDGDMDLFVGNGQGLRYVDDGKRLEVVKSASSRLYRNDGHMKFTDVTDAANVRCSAWVNGIAVGDVENDGDPDIYLACFGPDVFLRNDGKRFVDATAAAGLGNDLWGASAAFGDADNDGDLDLYVANYCVFDPEHPPAGGKRNVIDGVEVGWGPEAENPGINVGAPDAFFRNDGTGRFENATKEAGLQLAKPLCSYGVVFTDVDGDGWQDILVANDGQPANLFHNLGGGHFRDEAVERGFAFNRKGDTTAAMGFAVEDFDGDGDFDVFRANFDLEENCLHVNDGSGHYVDESADHGLGAPSFDKLGWDAAFFDVDCDGDLDLLVANGHVYPQAEQIGMHPWLQRTQLFEAIRDSEGRVNYRDATDDAGPGLAPLRSARGIALADADDDGDVDALVVDLDERPRLLENRSVRKGAWVSVHLVGAARPGAPKGSNRDGYGARVSVTAGDRTWVREMRVSQGVYSSSDPRLHFGLGAVSRIDRIEIRWPSGREQTIDSPPLGRVLTIHEPEAAR